MGYVANITYEKFPKQTYSHHPTWVGKTFDILFHYKPPPEPFTQRGVCVRDDCEDPGVMIFRITEGVHIGKYVLSTECQFAGPLKENT